MRTLKTIGILALTAAALAILSTGCSQRVDVTTLKNETIAYTSDDAQELIRLTPLVLGKRKTHNAAPVVAKRFWFSADRFTKPPGRIFTRATQTISPVSANDYTECRIRLRSPIAGQFSFIWQNAVEPNIAENAGLSFTVLGDNQIHEYTIALEGQDATGWIGPITAVGVVGPGRAIDIESITLAHTSPDGPERITLNNVTMESVDAHPTVWTVRVPAKAQFETHVALLDPPEVLTDGVVFRVRVREGETEAVTLIEKSINAKERGNWHALRASLEPFAGATVSLSLEVDARRSARGDYAVWGNPIVFGQDTKSRTPIILISCDTMRADHLSCYGYGRETSPNLDAFAREAVLFENAVTPETWTLPAHTSMLTGLYPAHHRVNASTNLAESVQTLPEVLARSGYLTGGFTGYRLWMSPSSGIAHGFDTYATPALVRDMVETKRLVDAWLEVHAAAPFFLFFHNYDLHSKFGETQCENCNLPYYPPPNASVHFAKDVREPETLRARGYPSPTDLLIAACGKEGMLSPDDIAHMVAMYDDSIRGVDAGLGELFAMLKAKGIYDDALIVITADHGEMFGEHNQFVHEHVYEGAARVPLLIKFQNSEHGGQRIRDMVQLIDLMPTILEASGVDAPPGDGHSLLPLIKGEGHAAPWAYIRRQTIVAVRSNNWKYLRDNETGLAELYHLANDPLEMVNVLDENPPELSELIELMERFYSEKLQGWHIAFMRPDREWEGTVIASTADSFESVKLLVGGSVSHNHLVKWDNLTANVPFGLLPRDEALIRTSAQDATISLRIRAAKPFDVFLGDNQPVKGKRFGAELDPSSPPAKPKLPAEVERPTFFIWHEAEPAEGTRADALTPEEVEALNALGYAQDVKSVTASTKEP